MVTPMPASAAATINHCITRRSNAIDAPYCVPEVLGRYQVARFGTGGVRMKPYPIGAVSRIVFVFRVSFQGGKRPIKTNASTPIRTSVRCRRFRCVNLVSVGAIAQSLPVGLRLFLRLVLPVDLLDDELSRRTNAACARPNLRTAIGSVPNRVGSVTPAWIVGKKKPRKVL